MKIFLVGLSLFLAGRAFAESNYPNLRKDFYSIEARVPDVSELVGFTTAMSYSGRCFKSKSKNTPHDGSLVAYRFGRTTRYFVSSDEDSPDSFDNRVFERPRIPEDVPIFFDLTDAKSEEGRLMARWPEKKIEYQLKAFRDGFLARLAYYPDQSGREMFCEFNLPTMVGESDIISPRDRFLRLKSEPYPCARSTCVYEGMWDDHQKAWFPDAGLEYVIREPWLFKPRSPHCPRGYVFVATYGCLKGGY